MKLSKLLLASAVIFYVIYDLISTIAAFNYLGTFQYEKSSLLKAAFDIAGVPGFVTIKMVLSMIALLLAYMLVDRFKQFQGVGMGLLVGASLAGAFVGTSNLNIILNGSSIWIGGIDSGTIAAVIIVGCSLLGFILSPQDRSVKIPAL
ncbi:MAG TPA: hypothetical protein VGK13_06480 [Methanocellaceae archaeon]